MRMALVCVTVLLSGNVFADNEHLVTLSTSVPGDTVSVSMVEIWDKDNLLVLNREVVGTDILVSSRFVASDFTGDGVVGLNDFFLFADWFVEPAEGNLADLNHDGSVNFDDFSLFADQFGYKWDWSSGKRADRGVRAEFFADLEHYLHLLGYDPNEPDVRFAIAHMRAKEHQANHVIVPLAAETQEASFGLYNALGQRVTDMPPTERAAGLYIAELRDRFSGAQLGTVKLTWLGSNGGWVNTMLPVEQYARQQIGRVPIRHPAFKALSTSVFRYRARLTSLSGKYAPIEFLYALGPNGVAQGSIWELSGGTVTVHVVPSQVEGLPQVSVVPGEEIRINGASLFNLSGELVSIRVLDVPEELVVRTEGTTLIITGNTYGEEVTILIEGADDAGLTGIASITLQSPVVQAFAQMTERRSAAGTGGRIALRFDLKFVRSVRDTGSVLATVAGRNDSLIAVVLDNSAGDPTHRWGYLNFFVPPNMLTRDVVWKMLFTGMSESGLVDTASVVFPQSAGVLVVNDTGDGGGDGGGGSTPSPQPGAPTISGPTHLFAHQSGVFTASASNTTRFEWYVGGALVRIGSAYTFSTAEIGTHIIVVRAVNNSGSDTKVSQSQVTVTIGGGAP